MAQVLDFNNALTQRELESYLGLDKEAPDPGRVDNIRSQLAASAAHFVASIFPAAVFSRKEARIGNIHGDPGGSLAIELQGQRAGLWSDFGDPNQKGGDLITLYQQHHRLSFPIALEHCAEWIGKGTRPEIAYQRQQVLSKAKKVERDLGPQKGEWHYTDADGSIIASVYRFEPEAGGKEFLPWDAVKRRYGNPDVRPLYNIPGILQAERVVFCEGEKAAKALIDQGIAATAVMGGANSPLDKSDLSPLARKDVLIWPDADAPGREFAARVALALKDVAASVEVYAPPAGKAVGWDAADAVEEGMDVESVLRAPADAPKPVLPFFWFDEAEPNLEANDFVEGLLTSSSMSVVYGPSNCGKTFFILDLALHVAWGKPWRGREVEKGAVVYLSLEGAQGVKNRVAAFRKHFGFKKDEKLPFAVMPKPVNLLDSEADVAAVIQLVRHIEEETGSPVRMVIIDTLSRAMAGGNENSSEDMTALIGNCDAIRSATGAHLSIVHHSGKDEARGARGHSSLRAATDTEIEIKREPGIPLSTVRIAKQRDLEADEPTAFTLVCVPLGKNRRGKEVTSCVAIEADGAAPTPGSKGLTSQEATALECLKEALLDHGFESVDPDGEVLRAVSTSEWKKALQAKGATDATNESVARAHLSRWKKSLSDKGFIEVFGKSVILAQQNATESAT